MSRLCRPGAAASLQDADWILVGVVAHTVTRKDKTDRPYCVWQLSDLAELERAAKLLLFRDVQEEHWREAVGTVVAVLRPKLLPATARGDTGGKNDCPALTVDSPLQVMVLGRSPDLGRCAGTTRSGEACRNIVNVASCSLCSYHVQAGYNKAKDRPEFANIG